MAFLYRRAAAGGPVALQRFHYHFEDYLQLLLLKVQFLDADHLLLSMGTAQHWAARNSDAGPHCSVFATYRWPTGQLVEVHHAGGQELVAAYLRHPNQFHTNVGDEPWARYVTPYGVSRVGREQIQSQLQHASWSQAQVQRRVASALPAGCQTLCTSPYLDACLFQYDERAISPAGRPRAMADQQPIKFVSRRHPDRLKFKLDVSAVMAAAAAGGGDARVPKHLRFVLHPMSPFLLVLLQGYGLPKAVLAVFYM